MHTANTSSTHALAAGAANDSAEKRASVVIATYNRLELLKSLLDDLDKQTLAAEAYEVLVVDDGSRVDVREHIEPKRYRYALTLERQANAGPAAARDRAAQRARGEVLVFVDDDMALEPSFLAEHLEAHARGLTVVQGVIAPAATLERMPVFERFHAEQLRRFVDGVSRGEVRVRGVDVCTGNVSMRRSAYLQVGGFDKALGRSEDRELGLRLERAGERFGLAAAAKSTHRSDHDSLEVWRRRAFNYGVYDSRIAAKHRDHGVADPWRFWFLVNPISKPLLLGTVALPTAGEKLADLVMKAALACDGAGLGRAAIAGTTLCYGLDYFRGVRAEAGSARRAFSAFARYALTHYKKGEE